MKASSHWRRCDHATVSTLSLTAWFTPLSRTTVVAKVADQSSQSCSVCTLSKLDRKEAKKRLAGTQGQNVSLSCKVMADIDIIGISLGEAPLLVR